MKRIAVMFGLGIAVSMSVRAASCGVHDENRRIADAKLENFANSLTNGVKAFEAGNAVIAAAANFGRGDKIETLTRLVDIAMSPKAEPMRSEEYMYWHDLIDFAGSRAARSSDPQDVLVKWGFFLKRYKVMQADSEKFRKMPDPFQDGTFSLHVDELGKKWGGKAWKCKEFYDERASIFQQYQKIASKRHYGERLVFDLRDELRDYYDTYKCFLHRDYRKMSPGAAEREILIKEVEEVLGRKPKWFPQIEDLTPEDAVERMGHDIECEFELARHEFGAFTKKLGAIPDMTRRAELIAKATEMVLVREPGRERLPNYNEIEVKVNWISALAGLLQNDKRASTAWSFRLRLLMAMKRVLERYEAANVSVWTAEGPMSIPTMRAHDIVKLQSLHNGYKKSMNDTEWQGLDALKIQLRILSYENQYFDGDDCVLKMCLARMTPEDRAETMKNVETVLGRKPKWYVDEARNAK